MSKPNALRPRKPNPVTDAKILKAAYRLGRAQLRSALYSLNNGVGDGDLDNAEATAQENLVELIGDWSNEEFPYRYGTPCPECGQKGPSRLTKRGYVCPYCGKMLRKT